MRCLPRRMLLGWTYQYWNTEEKDRVFEKVRTKKGAKIEGAEIIPATCIYTEPYMVKFLVQNSLGAMWMGMTSEARSLCEGWEYDVRDADRASVSEEGCLRNHVPRPSLRQRPLPHRGVRGFLCDVLLRRVRSPIRRRSAPQSSSATSMASISTTAQSKSRHSLW